MGDASVDDAFVAWCESKGCCLDGVELRESPYETEFNAGGGEAIGTADGAARGRGVFASRDSAKGDRVLTVPYAACLGTAGLKCGAGSGASPPFEGASPAECLAWTLLAARADDSDAWAPYLAASPPRSTHQPPDRGNARRWPNSRSARGSSRPPCASPRTPRRRAPSPAARASRATRSPARTTPPATPDRARVVVGALVRAQSRPRAHPEGGGSPQSLLVPFVDMLNHVHEDPLVFWTSVPGDGDGDAGAAVALVAEQHISAGDELTIFLRHRRLLGRVRAVHGFPRRT